MGVALFGLTPFLVTGGKTKTKIINKQEIVSVGFLRLAIALIDSELLLSILNVLILIAPLSTMIKTKRKDP